MLSHVYEASEPCLWIKVADELDRVPAPQEDLLTDYSRLTAPLAKLALHKSTA